MNRPLGVLCLVLGMAACAADNRASEPQSTSTGGPPVPAAAPAPSRPRIVALGDSLTAGLGLEPHESYPALLQKRIDREGLNYEVINAGVSGDTSAGGLRRVDWALDGNVKILIVALGGNDALRGLPVEQLRQNLGEIVERARSRGIKVVLAGMEAPPNYGAGYTADFRRTYREVAKQYDLALVPFLLDGVAGLSHMNQSDGIHPTAAGAQQVADNLWAALQPIVTAE